MSQSAGMDLMAKILQEKRTEDFLKLNRDFIYKDELKVYDFVKTFHDKHRTLPSIEVARRKTKLIDAVTTKDPFEYFLGEYANRALFNQFGDVLPKVSRHLQTRDMNKAVAEISSLLERTKRVSGENVHDTWETETFTLKDAYKKREPLPYLVEGLLPLPSLSIVYGAPGSLKSFLLGDMSVCVAGGQQWLGRKVVKSPVLFVDLDNGKLRTHGRFEALGKAHKLPADVPLFYTSMPSSWLNANEPQDVENMIQRMNRQGIKLLVVDCLDRIRGDVSENDPEMANVMMGLRLISERTGAAISTIHHQRKSGNGRNSARAGESLRGHSSIEASCDLILLVERESPSTMVTVRCTKNRDSDVPVFHALFKHETKPSNDKELLAASFVPSDIDDLPSPAKDTEDFIMELLAKKKSMNQSEIVKRAKEHLSVGRPQIREVLSAMTDRGTLKTTMGSRNAMLYSLKNPPVRLSCCSPKGGNKTTARKQRKQAVIRNNKKQLKTTKQQKDDLDELL